MKPVTKARATSITITRREGPAELCDVAHTFSGESCWLNASLHMARSFPTLMKQGFGTDQHDLAITFSDGTKYKGRLEMHQGRSWIVADHVRSSLEYRASSRNVIGGAQVQAAARDFLDSHEIGGDSAGINTWPLL